MEILGEQKPSQAPQFSAFLPQVGSAFEVTPPAVEEYNALKKRSSAIYNVAFLLCICLLCWSNLMGNEKGVYNRSATMSLGQEATRVH